MAKQSVNKKIHNILSKYAEGNVKYLNVEETFKMPIKTSWGKFDSILVKPDILKSVIDNDKINYFIRNLVKLGKHQTIVVLSYLIADKDNIRDTQRSLLLDVVLPFYFIESIKRVRVSRTKELEIMVIKRK